VHNLLPAGLQHVLLLQKACRLPLLLQLVAVFALLLARQSACLMSPEVPHPPNPAPQLLQGRC
jgi:hypothetical protein